MAAQANPPASLSDSQYGPTPQQQQAAQSLARVMMLLNYSPSSLGMAQAYAGAPQTQPVTPLAQNPLTTGQQPAMLAALMNPQGVV
jgi:hypothetical protein